MIDVGRSTDAHKLAWRQFERTRWPWNMLPLQQKILHPILRGYQSRCLKGYSRSAITLRSGSVSESDYW